MHITITWLVFFLFVFLFFFILYFVIKYAVKNGINESYHFSSEGWDARVSLEEQRERRKQYREKLKDSTQQSSTKQ